jgi:hypothetical protein
LRQAVAGSTEGDQLIRKITGICLVAAILAGLGAMPVTPARAWGDAGHEIIGLIAQSFLEPGTRRKVDEMLNADPDFLTAHDIASASTWADKYRDANINGARMGTGQWHFIDIEIDAPNLDQACFGHPAIPPGTPASSGPANDCSVDKIDEFAAELADPATAAGERVVALKFLLHLLEDLHQPLHAADDHDRGGNDKRAAAAGLHWGPLHHYWDTEFVQMLGPDPRQIADELIRRISPLDVRDWSRGTPTDWVWESFRMAKADAYGQLPPPNARGGYPLPASYVAMARRDVALQLSKAGVRLAAMLNRALH